MNVMAGPIEQTHNLLTMQEAADLCRVDYDTFRRWVSKGAIEYITVGPSNLKRFYRRDVLRMREAPAIGSERTPDDN